jgi:uncharacterized protein (DUF1330 family)
MVTTAPEPLALLVILMVSRARLDDFRAFERHAARIMRRYGGAIERTLVFPLDDMEQLKEVHVVSFPSAQAFDDYRADSELARLAPMRERAIVSTEIWTGRNGPEYMAELGAGATLAR